MLSSFSSGERERERERKRRIKIRSNQLYLNNDELDGAFVLLISSLTFSRLSAKFFSFPFSLFIIHLEAQVACVPLCFVDTKNISYS